MSASSPRVLAVLIGRAGSRGLPGKNALPIAGRPMICHTIEHALSAQRVQRVVVSTDGETIAEAARGMGVEVIMRPVALASDEARVDEAVRHAAGQSGDNAAIIVILYANVPVRPAGLIDRAVQRLIESGADSVQSYAPAGKHHPAWMVRLDANGRVGPLQDGTVHRRQDLPPCFLPDGGVIAVRRDALFRGAATGDPHAFLGADRRGIETRPGQVIDVDTPADARLAEAILTAAGSRPAAAGMGDAGPGIGIAERRIGPESAPYIIAEIGVNHDGSADCAVELVRAARDAGADAVKLQLFRADLLLSSAARPAAYQQRAGEADPHGMLRRLELTDAEMGAIAEEARRLGLHVIATAFNIELLEAAAALNCDAMKTASPDIINRPLIEALKQTGRPLIISTGASSAEEVAAVTRWLGGYPHLLMQCVSAYPTPDEAASLAARAAMERINPNALGYSDHTTAVDTGALAVASGARLLEKHLTHDRSAPGPDHNASLDPQGFADYVRLAHRAWTMLGRAEKLVLEIERDVRAVARQSLTAGRALGAGHTLQRGDLAIRRPGTGLPPSQLEAVLGRRLARPVEAGEPLQPADLA